MNLNTTSAFGSASELDQLSAQKTAGNENGVFQRKHHLFSANPLDCCSHDFPLEKSEHEFVAF